MIPTAPWLFPTPTRASRFISASPAFAALNREVAQDLVAPWSFQDTDLDEAPLYYDYQTQLESNASGRLGAGRAGVYQGYYLKGVGRTPAAANWSHPGDRYHASGHMSVSSALRERLITKALQARGLDDAIDPCETILLAPLREEERQQVALGHTSARPERPADMHLMAISAKPANFTRQSNIIWALDHFSAAPADLGALFLAIEQATSLTQEPKEGDPAELAEALSQGFLRGLQNFLRFAKEGLYWSYLQNNFTLDGRFVDLETPVYLGQPIVGMRSYQDGEQLFGFEVFGFVVQWRLFIRALRAKLSLLNTPPIMREKACRSYLRSLSQELKRVFSPRHIMYQDEALQRRQRQPLIEAYHLNRKAKAQLKELTASAFQNTVLGVDRRFLTKGWAPADLAIDAPMVDALALALPPYIAPQVSSAARSYSANFQGLAQHTNPHELLAALET